MTAPPLSPIHFVCALQGTYGVGTTYGFVDHIDAGEPPTFTGCNVPDMPNLLIRRLES